MIKYSSIFFFILYFLHIYSNIRGNYPLLSLLVGSYFIYEFQKDIKISLIKINYYHIILIYFYYQISVAPNYNSLNSHNNFFWPAYIINLLGAISFIYGYRIYGYKYNESIK